MCRVSRSAIACRSFAMAWAAPPSFSSGSRMPSCRTRNCPQYSRFFSTFLSMTFSSANASVIVMTPLSLFLQTPVTKNLQCVVLAAMHEHRVAAVVAVPFNQAARGSTPTAPPAERPAGLAIHSSGGPIDPGQLPPVRRRVLVLDRHRPFRFFRDQQQARDQLSLRRVFPDV